MYNCVIYFQLISLLDVENVKKKKCFKHKLLSSHSHIEYVPNTEFKRSTKNELTSNVKIKKAKDEMSM